jgi:hypothetical protein
VAQFAARRALTPEVSGANPDEAANFVSRNKEQTPNVALKR